MVVEEEPKPAPDSNSIDANVANNHGTLVRA